MNKSSIIQLIVFSLLFFGSNSALKAGPSAAVKGAKTLIDDDYSSAEYSKRNAARGPWKIENGIATVKHDDELYKKYKNHGPIMIYNVPHTDAIVVVEVKPTDCKTVVFTMDAAEGGHAFRVKLRTQGKSKGGPSSQIVTYAAKKEGAEKAETIVLNSDDTPKLINNEWNRIEISVVGEKATFKLGDKTVQVKHPRIAQEKSIAKIGFAFGSLSLRKFSLEAK